MDKMSNTAFLFCGADFCPFSVHSPNLILVFELTHCESKYFFSIFSPIQELPGLKWVHKQDSHLSKADASIWER